MQYTQIFRIRAYSWLLAYTVYSIFPGPGQVPSRERMQYTQIFLGPGSFLDEGVYLYTQKARAQAGS